MKGLILGGGKQNFFLYKKLISEGYDFDLWGFDLLNPREKENLDLSLYSKIITPIPLSLDNLTLYSPHSTKTLYIEYFYKRIKEDVLIIGGKEIHPRGHSFNITQSRDFISKTVIPVTEELIKIVVSSTDSTIADSRISVLSTGILKDRIEKTFTLLGGEIVPLGPETETLIYTGGDNLKKAIDSVKKRTVVIDISNNSEIISNRVIKARGLASKSAPRSFAKYLYETILKEDILK